VSHFPKGRKTRGDRGAALVEFALVSLLFIFFIYAVAVFGILLSTKNGVTHAAAEGARSALSVPDQPSATLDARRIAQATTTVADSLSHLGSNYDPADTVASIAGCTSPADPVKCITVTITYPWDDRPLVPQAPFIKAITPETIHATAVVRLN
jgi:Flp pilus assembly protein TadG